MQVHLGVTRVTGVQRGQAGDSGEWIENHRGARGGAECDPAVEFGGREIGEEIIVTRRGRAPDEADAGFGDRFARNAAGRERSEDIGLDRDPVAELTEGLLEFGAPLREAAVTRDVLRQ